MDIPVTSRFIFTLLEWIFDGIRIQLEPDTDDKEERLHEHLQYAVVFPESSIDSSGRDGPALNDWISAAFPWIVNIRKLCKHFIRQSKPIPDGNVASFDKDTGTSKLSFDEIVIATSTLHDEVNKILMALTKASDNRTSTKTDSSGSAVSDALKNDSQTTEDTLEEGEIEQDDDAVRAAYWEHFKDMNEYMCSFEPARGNRVSQHRDLERQIKSCMVAKPCQVDIVLEDLRKVVSILSKGARLEAERLLVEIKENLEKLKVDEHSRTSETLEAISCICQEFSASNNIMYLVRQVVPPVSRGSGGGDI